MRKKIIATLAGGGLLAATFAATIDWSDAEAVKGSPPPPTVPVAQVEIQQVEPTVQFSGSFSPVESVEVRPLVSGPITAVHLPEGGMVSKGQLLFQIDPRPFRIVVDQAKAQLRQAQAAAALAESAFARSEQLVATGAVAQANFEDATAQRRSAGANVDAARAALAAAQLNLSYTRVTSPISGRADRALLTSGNVVGAGAVAAPLTTIRSVDPLHVFFSIDEKTYLAFFDRLRAGGKARSLVVRVGLMDEEGYPYEATLDFLSNQIDRSTGTIRARAVVRNPDGKLAPGLFAKIRLSLGDAEPTMLVPDEAIGSEQDKSFVLVIGKDSKAEYRPVEVGPRIGGLRVVRSGLKPSDRVIVKGLVRPGMQVTPKLMPRATAPSPHGDRRAR